MDVLTEMSNNSVEEVVVEEEEGGEGMDDRLGGRGGGSPSIVSGVGPVSCGRRKGSDVWCEV